MLGNIYRIKNIELVVPADTSTIWLKTLVVIFNLC